MIDLHIHTTATPHHSSWEPDALARAAAQAGLQVIAAADHNTTANVQALQAAGRQHGVAVVSGVEIDSGFGSKLWHTLVYGADPAHPALLELCAAVFERNRADALALIERLERAGFDLSGLDQLDRPANVADVGYALAHKNDLPGRVAGEDDEAAGMRYILTQLPDGYRPVSVEEVVAVAHAASGVAVLAHPGRSKGVYAVPATADDLAAMAAVGLDGVEVFYPTHTHEQRAFYAQLAGSYGLFISGGSDSHHPHQQLARWPSDRCLPLLDRLGVV